MNATIAILLFLSVTGIPDTGLIREKYKKAIESETETNIALALLEPVTIKNPLLYAYKGAFIALLAKHAINPYTKLEKVKQASGMLDEAVHADSEQIEIRYLRYSIEKKIPSFLPYNQHVLEDENKIIRALTQKTVELTPELRKDIALFMLKNAELEPETIKLLESLTR